MAGWPPDLWDLAGWAARARDLLGRLEHLPPTDPALLAPGFELSAAVLRLLQADPLLPADLLPGDWPGPGLRNAYDAWDRRYRSVLRAWGRVDPHPASGIDGPIISAAEVGRSTVRPAGHAGRGSDAGAGTMTGKRTGEAQFAGRVAVITGGARGQGRSHAVGLARLGADIAGGRPVRRPGHRHLSPGHPEDDLAETVRLVEAEGRRCVSATVVDVRDLDAMVAFVDGVAAEFWARSTSWWPMPGSRPWGRSSTSDAAEWSETIDTNLTGVFNAMRAAAPHMRRNRWGRMIGISSMMGRTAQGGIPAYCASKWGVIGLTKSVALEMARFGVTVNAIAPGNVSTDMIHNDMLYRVARPDLEHPTAEDVAPAMAALHVQPVPWLEPDEITAAVVFLCSEGARHITGSVIDVDAGASARFTA